MDEIKQEPQAPTPSQGPVQSPNPGMQGPPVKAEKDRRMGLLLLLFFLGLVVGVVIIWVWRAYLVEPQIRIDAQLEIKEQLAAAAKTEAMTITGRLFVFDEETITLTIGDSIQVDEDLSISRQAAFSYDGNTAFSRAGSDGEKVTIDIVHLSSGAFVTVVSDQEINLDSSETFYAREVIEL